MAKPRVLISTDIGGSDPDDIQSMVHALLYADKVNYVGFVSSPTAHGGRERHIHEAIDAYAKDFAKLKTWGDYPTPDHLHSIATQGRISPQPSQGWSSATEGSNAIIKAAHASAEPLWVLVWGAMTDVAQALHDDPSIAAKIRIYSLGSWNTQQDPAARNYVYNQHKDVWWIESNSTMRGMYVDDSGAGRNAWKMSDAIGHGALGDHFHKAMPWGLKMGDTPSLLYLLDGSDNNNPAAGGWGGTFVKTGHGPNYWTDSTAKQWKNGPYNGSESVQRYQSEIYKDFAARLDRAKEAKSGAPAQQDQPVRANDDGAATKTGEAIRIQVLKNDQAPDGGLKVASADASSKQGGKVAVGADGVITYTPKAGFAGSDSFLYTARDADGDTDPATVTVQVTKTAAPAGPPPAAKPQPAPDGGPVTAHDDFKATARDKALYENSKYLVWNDKGAAGGLKVVSVDGRSDAGATITWAKDGTIKYQPLKGYQGADRFDYVVQDRNGATDTGTVYVKVGHGQSPAQQTPASGPKAPAQEPVTYGGTPVAYDDFHSVGRNKTLYHNSKYLTFNDRGGDGELKVVQVDGKSAQGGAIAWGADGTMAYRPSLNFQGEDSFNYIVRGKNGSTDTGTVFVQVGQGQSAGKAPALPTASAPGQGVGPDAGADLLKAQAGKVHLFNVKYLTWNDKGDGPLRVIDVDDRTKMGGSVKVGADGTAAYRPPSWLKGDDQVTYTVADAAGRTDTAVITFDLY